MKLIDRPKTFAERIVNAVCEEIYQRSGGDHWFEGIDADVMADEVIPGLVAAVERELRRLGDPI